MKIFCSFAWAIINAGGSVGPSDPVTGKILFGVVMAAAVGYMFGRCAEEVYAWGRSKWLSRT